MWRSLVGLLGVLFATTLVGVTAGACSPAGRSSATATADGGAGEDASAAGTDFVDGAAPTHEVLATLRGSVRAPNPQIPIAGALVYLAAEAPAPLTRGKHCDECVTLSADTPFAITEPDGSFELPSYELGVRTLIVQKGGFRRAREFDVVGGDNDVPRALTTLPSARNAAQSDEVPAMAVVSGSYDKIEDSLVELGLTKAALTMVSDADAFLRDAKRLDAFDIVFLPCGSESDLSVDPTTIKNLRSFAEGGGRLYVTDWHYDFVHQPWAGYVGFEGQSTQPCSGCGGMYNAPAKVEDPGLEAWLAAQGVTTFQLEKNYTKITSINARPGKDKAGNDVTITPKVWVNGLIGGKPQPSTVSFEQGCGRVLFSTYHTESSGAGSLLPQERALLYVLLEVSVCTGSENGVIVK